MDDRDKKFSKPGMPPLPPGFPKLGAPQLPQGAKPSLPGAPQLPSFGQAPFTPQLPQPAAAPAPVRDTAAEDALKAEKDKLEAKISDMEKLLSQEKERALLATLKNQQDEALSSRVEMSLKDIQEKMRRDRRDNEVEEERIALKGKIKEMESRLAQERETWMQTLKSQVSERETQGRDVEGHFINRLQEMERRWLDEKAQWQKEISAREATINSLKYADTKLRETEDEVRQLAMEKSMMEREAAKLRDEVARAEREKASIESYIKIIPEKERELAELKSDNAVLRGREENYRMEGKHREEKYNFEIEKLQKEIGRVQADMGSISDRKNEEKNEELKKMQMRFEFQLQEKEKAIADVSGEKIRAISELVKIKGFVGRVQAINAVLEKERGLLKLEKMQLAQNMAAQLEEIKRIKAEGEALKAARQAEMEAQNASYKADVERAKSEYGAQLASRHAAELSKLAAAHQAELNRTAADRQAETDSKLSQLRVKYEGSAEDEKAALRRQLEAVHDAQMKEVRSALAAAQDSSMKFEAEARRLAATAKEFEAALEIRSRDYESRLARAELQLSAVNSQKGEAEKYAQAAKADSEKNVQAARAEFQRLAAAEAAARGELSVIAAGKAAAENAKAETEAQLQKLREDLRLESENRTRFESELLFLKQKMQQMDMQAQETSEALEAERSGLAGLQASAASQRAADSARIAELSANLEKYRAMESSFADRLKWAIKGKKSE